MNIEKLLKQKEAIEAQIVKANLAGKNKGRVEKLVLKLVAKHPDLYLVDLKILEQKLDDSFAGIAGNLANR